jgi:hypothetical protein
MEAIEVEAVRNTVASVAHHIDAKRWVELRALYAHEVETDYTSLFGGTPQTQSGDALISGWKTILATVQTQHLLGPVVVELSGATARARCHVRAMHRAAAAPSGELWEVLGHYVFDLSRGERGWAITKMMLLTQLQTGNTQLLREASTL